MRDTVSTRRTFAILFFVSSAFCFGATASAQSTFDVSFNPAVVGPGGGSTLRFDIVNTDAVNPMTDIAFSNVLPAAVVIATPAQATSNCGGVLVAPNGAGVISFSGGSIGVQGACSIMVDVTSAVPGVHTNTTGDLTSSAGNSGTATADLTVADDRPGFSKSFSPDVVSFGARSTLTLTIDNSANGSIAANLTFSDQFPVGMVIANPPAASGDCGGGVINASPGASSLSYGPSFFGDAVVGAGSVCSIAVDVIGGAVGELGNTTGELTSTGQFGGVTKSSGTAGAVLSVTNDVISLVKEFVSDPAAPGGVVGLEFSIRNLDRGFAATDISFSDDLDSVLSGLVALDLPMSDPCGAGSVLTGTDAIVLTGGTLGPEEMCTFSINLAIPATAPSGEYANITTPVSAQVDGSVVVGSPAEDVLYIQPRPRLTAEFIDDPVGSGGVVTLEYTILNQSPTSSAADIEFDNVFVSELPSASATPADGFCGPDSSAVFTPLVDPTGSDAIPARLAVSGASLNPGMSCTFSVLLDVSAGASTGTYVNTTGEISANIGGDKVIGPPAVSELSVVAAPWLTKEFIDDPVAPGETVTLEFTLTHDEDSPGPATNISFSDAVSSTVPGLEAIGLPLTGICGAGSEVSGTSTVTFGGGDLGPGESCTFSVQLQVPVTAAAGSHPNATSPVFAEVLGLSTVGNAAADDLRIAGLTLTKEFLGDPVIPGGPVDLRFVIENTSPASQAVEIFFRDDLDAVVDDLMAVSLPPVDSCGSGASLLSQSGGRLLVFQGGALGPGESCSFDVALQVPASAAPDVYVNTTSSFLATIDGQLVAFDNAHDELIVSSDLVMLRKEFLDDPVAPGDDVVLRFMLDNLDTANPLEDIAFTDDLGAVLAGLVSTSGTMSGICGLGSEISGTDVLTFSGGTLGPGESCAFDVVLSVPGFVPLGTTATNTTSRVSGNIGGLVVSGDPATDDLSIEPLSFDKSFSGDASPGDTVGLEFTIRSWDTNSATGSLGFTDDLDAVLPGLAATGLPVQDVCGEGSVLSGSSLLTLIDGEVLPGGSCTFEISLEVPPTAAAGSYLNVTSDLLQNGLPVAGAATATLNVFSPVDDDNDGVIDSEDRCLGTVIPEGVPTEHLGVNRYALIDDDLIFDTRSFSNNGFARSFTTTDTAGCSCEQIIEELELGQGHTKFGCSIGAMREWITGLDGSFSSEGIARDEQGGSEGATD